MKAEHRGREADAFRDLRDRNPQERYPVLCSDSGREADAFRDFARPGIRASGFRVLRQLVVVQRFFVVPELGPPVEVAKNVVVQPACERNELYPGDLRAPA
jgi:hypothetical protein